MKIRKWLYLFFTTLLIGGILGIGFGLAFNWSALTGAGFYNLFFGLLELFGFGCMFSVISQMGFFAFLTIHRFGMGMFGAFWDKILIVLTAFVLFDLFYFRLLAFGHSSESFIYYLWVPLFLLIVSWAVAFQKKKETNRTAFVPTLFYMVVITSLEWYYPLKTNTTWMWTVFAVLLACNAWQVLLLHRLLEKPQKS